MVPRVKAVKLLGHAAQGQTLPLIFDCIAYGTLCTFQVKVASRRNGLTPRELACEVLCTGFAGAAGLRVSSPAFVSLSDEVVTAVEKRYGMDLADTVGAGVLWIDYLRPLVLPVDISTNNRGKVVPNPLLRDKASRTLALDLLLCNGDRTSANPNLAWEGGSMLVFDFEHCLELRGPQLDRMLAAHLELLPNLHASHIFSELVPAATLKEELDSCADMLHSHARMNAEAEHVPDSWRAPWMAILAYAEYLSAHRDVIIDAALADT